MRHKALDIAIAETDRQLAMKGRNPAPFVRPTRTRSLPDLHDCPHCGAPLEFWAGSKIYRCPDCRQESLPCPVCKLTDACEYEEGGACLIDFGQDAMEDVKTIRKDG